MRRIIWLTALLIAPMWSWGATTRYINTASTNGDGTTNATSGGTAAFSSMANAMKVLAPLAQDTTVYCTGTAADTAYCAIGTTSTYVLTFIGDASTGTWNNSKYRMVLGITYSPVVNITSGTVVFDRIQFSRSVGTSGNYGIFDTNTAIYTTSVTVKNCILDGGAGYSHWGINARTCDYFGVINTVLYNFYDASDASAIRPYYTANSCNIYNVTISSCANGVDNGDGNAATVRNSLFYINGQKDIAGTVSAGSGYNTTSRPSIGQDAGGSTGNRVGQTFTFMAASLFDYHLLSTDAGAKSFGSTPWFPTDLDGTTWVTNDMGAYSAPGAGGGGGTGSTNMPHVSIVWLIKGLRCDALY